jgi:DNA helicase-2/ATP-dependent DNA helicase PcrA
VELTPAQTRAITHAGSPLLVLGGPGTGKTRVLVERLVWLTSRGTRPEEVLLLTGTAAAADALRRRAEDRPAAGGGELAVTTVPDLCAAACSATTRCAPGWTRSSFPVTAADRVALLLDRLEQLTLQPPRLPRQPRRAARRGRGGASTAASAS